MIFVDSNLPMYLVGRDPDRRAAAQREVDRLLEAGGKLVTSAEVLQEILHRYAALRLPEALGPCFETTLGIVDEVLPVTLEDAIEARNLFLRYPGLSARDALHAAVMHRHGIEEILTYDAGFDAVPWIRRIGA